MRIKKPRTRARTKWLLIVVLPMLLLPPLIHFMRQRTVTIQGPDVDPVLPPKVPERPYTLLADALHSHYFTDKFEVWSGALGSTTQLTYNRREQTLVTSFYLLSSDFHTQWRNVPEKTIEAIAQAEKTGNKIWWEKGDFQSIQIDADALLRKLKARIVKKNQNDLDS